MAHPKEALAFARPVSGNGSRGGRRARTARTRLLAVVLLPSCAFSLGCTPFADVDDAYNREVHALEVRIEGTPPNAELAAEVQGRLSRVRSDPSRAASEISQRLDALGLVPLRVPGLFYRSHAWTGADLAGVQVWLGREVVLVETGETDTVENSSARVRQAVFEATAAGRRAVLFSASKGGADVQAALGKDPALASRVAAWIDLVGLLEGTPLTDPGVAEAERTALGLPEETARSISRRARQAERAVLPPRLIVVHLAGFPETSTITPAARPGFERLRGLGPNDGFLLLDAFLRAPGRVLVLPDADHYLRTPTLGPTVVALLSVLLDELAAGSNPTL
jgi:hypothetical protein